MIDQGAFTWIGIPSPKSIRPRVAYNLCCSMNRFSRISKSSRIVPAATRPET